MWLDPPKLGTKLRLALLGTAILSILALVAVTLPILRSLIREDRVKLFVEQSTRALAETVSHHLEQYHERVRTLASKLALNRGAESSERRLLDQGVAEPVPGVFPQGIFDLLVVVRRDGTILHTNRVDRFGSPLDTTPLWGRHISEFSEEERTFLGALRGTGKHDWYRSPLVAAVRPEEPAEVSRRYAIAYAGPVPGTDRVLLAIINWEAVQKVLDNIEGPLAKVGFPSGYAFMFARDGNSIIAHKFRNPARVNNYGTRLISDHHLEELAQAVREGQLSHRYEYPSGKWKVSGLARVDDADFGWTVGVGINDEDVIAPMQALTWRLVVLSGAVIALALLLSHYLSHRITLNLREVTRSALRIAEGERGEMLAVRSHDEVGQLAQAFNTMAVALADRERVISEQQLRLLERVRLEQELSIAAEVQKRLFPQFQPPLATLDYAGFCQPASGVSGDYYDFLALAPGKLGILVADVAGKGISAALLMASLHACIRTHAPLLGDRCGEVASTMNSLLYEATDPERFATIFYATYDDATGLLTYVNAGHYPPLLVRAAQASAPAHAAAPHAARAAREAGHLPTGDSLESGAGDGHSSERLSFGTPPIGLFEALPAVQKTEQLMPGDWLLIFSDGVIEACNARQEEFGDDCTLIVARVRA